MKRAEYELPFVTPQQAARDTFALVDRLQTIGLDEANAEGRKLAAAAMLFREVAIQTGAGTAQVLNQVERMARDAEDLFPAEIRALREYIQKEVK